MADPGSPGHGPIIAVGANDGWNIVNYRSGLIRALRGAGMRVAVLAPSGAHDQAIRAIADFYPVPVSARGTSPTADMRTLLAFRRQLKSIGPAAFLGFTAKPNIYGSIAARSLGIPVINNISGLGSTFGRRTMLTRLMMGLYRFAIRRSAVVFFQNSEDRRLFEQARLVRQDQTALLPGSGIDLDHFAPRPRDPHGGDFTFLLAARLLWDKGVREYVEAARRVRSGGKRAKFQILGIIEPESRAAVPLAQLEAWARDGIIDYLGSARDVRPAIAAAGCVVLPSYYREGVPRVLLEAASMAVPVITTDWPGCREAVEDGETGLLCEPRSAEALAAAMEQMLGISIEERLQMGQAGRARMEREFAEAIVHRAYLSALARLGIEGIAR
ncbi:MAG TPA: glycosyltransferase family 4 protein [Sphingomicrobium sp.]|nr:glycosyltransferase family 4 protein [Sphingomicrobium sp.]